jgi:hypothetical protein
MIIEDAIRYFRFAPERLMCTKCGRALALEVARLRLELQRAQQATIDAMVKAEARL